MQPQLLCCRFDMGDNAPQVSDVKVYQHAGIAYCTRATAALIQQLLCCRFDMGDNAPQVSGVKVYQAAASGADEVLIELDVGWTSDAEMSMIVHPMSN